MSATVRRLDRVLMLLPSAEIGGAEVHSAWLAEGLTALGVGVRLAIAPGLRDRFARLLGGALVGRAPEAAAVGWDREAPPAEAEARQATAAAALIAEWRPDVAVLPLPWPSHALGLQRACAEAAVPVLAVAHLAPRDPDPVDARLGPTRWVAVSDPVTARLAACSGLPAGSVTTVPNGVPVPPWDPARQGAARAAKRAALGLRSPGPAGRAPLLVFAGRLESNKGADLLPGLAALLRARTGAVLAALGDGPLRPALARHAAAAEGALHLPGHVTDLPDWLLAADALLLPSRLEGCPLVFLEA